MEAIGVATSIVALVELGSKVSYKLFTFSKQVVQARAAIESLAQEVASVNVVLQQLVIQLKKDEESPSRLCTDNLVNSARACVEKCKSVFKDIDELVIDGLEIKRLSLKQKMKFSYNAPKVELHLKRLDGLKLSLSVTLNTIIYAEVVRSREEGFVLSNQLQVLKSLYKEKMVIEAEAQELSVVLPNPYNSQLPHIPTSSNYHDRQNEASAANEGHEDATTSRGLINPIRPCAPEALVTSSEKRANRRKRRRAMKMAQRELEDRFLIESRRRPVALLCDDKDMILYSSLVEDILRSISSNDYIELDMRKRSSLHAAVVREHHYEMRLLLEPGGPYTAQEITACLREGSMLMKYWLEDLRLGPVPRTRRRSNSSTSSDSDSSTPIRTSPTQVLPVRHNTRGGAQRLRTRGSTNVIINSSKFLQLPKNRPNIAQYDDHNRSRSRRRGTANFYGGRDRSGSKSGSDTPDDNLSSDADSEDIKALLESLTTLTPEEIATSLYVEND